MTFRNMFSNLAIALLLCASALAWDCPKGQIRQQAPPGTPTTTPYYDVVEGIAFICVPSTPTTPSTGSNSNVNNNTNNNTNNNSANSSSTSNTKVNTTVKLNNTLSNTQSQNQNQSQTATGGNATSSATGGAGGSATATGNGDGSNNNTSIYDAAHIPVNTAIAPPILPTAPCTKGYSAGGQGASLGLSGGFSRVDQGCDDRELARAFEGPQTKASCKILVNTKKAKKAGVTMDDCLAGSRGTVIFQSLPAPAPIAQAPIVIPAPLVSVTVTPAPVVTLPAPPQYRTSVTVHAPVKHVKPECQNQLVMRCVVHKKNAGGGLSKNDAGTKG